MKNIVILRKSREIDKPINIFSDWHTAGSWADKNVRSSHHIHHFKKVGFTKSIFYLL